MMLPATKENGEKEMNNFWKKRGNDEGVWACFHTWKSLNRRQSSAPASPSLKPSSVTVLAGMSSQGK